MEAARREAGRPDRSLAALEFESGTLSLTEAGSQRRASLHVVAGGEGLRALDAGGIDVLGADLGIVPRSLLTLENHTLKRALTDPRLFSGIGNAYSDEILQLRACRRVAQTAQAHEAREIARLFDGRAREARRWTRSAAGRSRRKFPEKVTAFREGMAVHGVMACPARVAAKIQRIRYAENETNYCAPCQTGGKLLADRGLSRLLREDWPRTLEEFEQLFERKKRH